MKKPLVIPPEADRPIMLALNPRGGFVIGIKLMEGKAVGAITDLNASILSKDAIDLPDTQVATSVDTLVSLVKPPGTASRDKEENNSWVWASVLPVWLILLKA